MATEEARCLMIATPSRGEEETDEKRCRPRERWVARVEAAGLLVIARAENGLGRGLCRMRVHCSTLEIDREHVRHPRRGGVLRDEFGGLQSLCGIAAQHQH